MNTNNEQDKRREKEGEQTKIYLTPDSTLQTPEEHEHDQSVDPRKDNTIAVSNDGLSETKIDRLRQALDGERGSSTGKNEQIL